MSIAGTPARTIAANQTRTDVNRVKRVSGKHGFTGTIDAQATGKKQVCVTANHIGSGRDRSLGCRTVNIPSGNPVGVLDSAVGGTGTVKVAGWAYDPSSTGSSLTGTVTIGGTPAGAITMNRTRSDVNRVKHVTGKHGFTDTVKTTKTGRQQVCVTADNIGAGADSSIGCKTLTISTPKPTNTPKPTPEPTQPAPTTEPVQTPTPTADPNAMPASAPAGWTRTFSEDFTTDAASGKFSDTYGDRFVAYDGFNDTSGAGKYSESALSTSGGNLNMRMHTDASGQPIGAAIVPLVGGQWGGQVEARYDIRMRADSLPGYGVAGLLWSDNNVWSDGEIDFPEGALDGNVTLSNHCPQSPADNCLHEDLDTTFTGWHTYTVERTATKLTFYVDGKVVASTTQNLPTKPLHWVLQAATHTGEKPAANVDGNVQVAWMTVSAPAGK